MASTQRTRRLPGPVLLVTLACSLAGNVALRAHDPGLSTLNVRVDGDVVSTTLIVAKEDLKPPEAHSPKALAELSRHAVRLALDGRSIHPTSDAVSWEEDAAKVVLAARLAGTACDGRRLEIRSAIPKIISRGHRQFLTVSVDGRSVVERLLDAESNTVTLDVAKCGKLSFVVSGVTPILFLLIASGAGAALLNRKIGRLRDCPFVVRS